MPLSLVEVYQSLNRQADAIVYLEAMRGIVTPTRLFFVCNNSASPVLEARDWHLLV